MVRMFPEVKEESMKKEPQKDKKWMTKHKCIVKYSSHMFIHL